MGCPLTDNYFDVVGCNEKDILNLHFNSCLFEKCKSQIFGYIEPSSNDSNPTKAFSSNVLYWRASLVDESKFTLQLKSGMC